jgi:hypothetical protein
MVAPTWGKYNYSKTRNLRSGKLHGSSLQANSVGSEIPEQSLPGREDSGLRIQITSLPEDLLEPARVLPVASWQAPISLPATRNRALRA